jgi:exodeoxyribonuclease VII large subunit
VQGKDAAALIADTLRLASDRADCDVLILTRGGGSLEDLWPFNEEVIARAIHACRIPLVSAVGHEIDFTIADFVADQRAPTPSAAAELVSPDQQEWLAQITTLAGRLEHRLRQRLQLGGQQAGWLEKRLQQLHPGQYLRQQSQRLDQLEQRSRFIVNRYISNLQSELNEVSGQLKRLSPAQGITRQRLRQDNLGQRLGSAMQRLLSDKQRRLGLSSRALNTISPLATLERGYAIVSRLPDRHILHQASKVKPGDRVEARLSEGVLVCSVEQTTEIP